MLDYMNCKYRDAVPEELINVTTLLDPRFRTEYMSESESNSIQAKRNSFYQTKVTQLHLNLFLKQQQTPN